MSDDMSAYKEVFLSESAEYVQSIVDGLLALESNPDDLEPVETVFRGAHSLKGMAAAMGYERTEGLTHKIESLMDTVRKGVQSVDSDLIDLVLRAVDTVRDLIEDESSGGEDVDVTSIVSELAAQTEAAGSEEPVEAQQEGEAPAAGEVRAGEPAAPVYGVKVRLAEDCVLKSVRAYMVLKRLNYIGVVLDTAPDARDIEDEKFDRTFEAVLQTAQTEEQIREAAVHITDVEDVEVEFLKKGERAGPADTGGDQTATAVAPKLSDTQTVRVSISHLDSMVDLVGELVIVRSRLESLAHLVDHADMHEALEELHRAASELQHEVMLTRMVPVANIFNRFPRMVRDLARDLGKEIEFDMKGLEIELDRTVLDEISDPVVHLLRNAIDHGVETPEDRESAGKERRGAVRLTATRERDQARIAVTDDGRGMDIEAIWAKAVERGVVAAEDRSLMSEEEILLLTCESGFSTAREATKVSGRGVGMDVVKGKIEYLGGSLSILTEEGQGSQFVLHLPLTLAIVQALLVSSGDQIFAVPLSAVQEVVSPDEMALDTVDGRPVVVLRDGTPAPLFRLDVIAGQSTDVRGMPGEGEHIVLVEAGEHTRALAVGTLIGRREVVIKPLSPMFKRVKGLGGAAVLGDGGIAIILDPRSFFAMGQGAKA